MKKILVFGLSGLVGSRWQELSKFKDCFVAPEYPHIDLTYSDSVRNWFEEAKPEVVVNFAAFTDVGKAEEKKGDIESFSWKINVDGVKNILDCLSPRTKFIQISTDMVFPATLENPGPYGEDQEAETDSNKLTWYGFTKAEAERNVKEKLGDQATILRLIYPVRAEYDLKLDYLRKPLSLFDQGKLYPMFTDQQVSIAFIDEMCVTLDAIIEQNATGTFHASSSNVGSPFEIVSYLLEKARGAKDVVKPSSIVDFLKTVDNPVRYPIKGGLKVELTEKKLGVKYSSWQKIIDILVDQGLE